VTRAVIKLGTYEFIIATGAPEFLQSGEHLPKNIVPRDLSLSQKHDEFVDIPVFIGDVFRNNLSIDIHKQITPLAVHPFFLIISE
jgi:hypothetical protein